MDFRVGVTNINEFIPWARINVELCFDFTKKLNFYRTNCNKI